MSETYLRFQGFIPIRNSSSRLGIFQLAFMCRDEPDLPKPVYDELLENIAWLKTHLKSPTILKEDQNFRSIAWFRSDAKEPLKRIWAIKAILDDAGYKVELLKTKDPGAIIYRDEWQVIAKPKKSFR